MRWLAQKEDFFEMLVEQSENALESAKELKNFVDNYSKFERSERKSKAQTIKNIEHKADLVTRKIIENLDKNVRVPFEKEDIRKMTLLLDDVIDLTNTVASRFIILSIERIDENILKMSDIINNAVSEVNKAVSELRKLKHIKEHCAKISDFEKEADDVYNEALAELFHYYKNSIDIIKYKEIYELLESIADKCKHIGNLAESIATKNA